MLEDKPQWSFEARKLGQRFPRATEHLSRITDLTDNQIVAILKPLSRFPGNPWATGGRKAGSLTVDLHPSLLASKSVLQFHPKLCSRSLAVPSPCFLPPSPANQADLLQMSSSLFLSSRPPTPAGLLWEPIGQAQGRNK